MNKKRTLTLFFILLFGIGSSIYSQDLPESRWYLKNTHPEGIRELFLYLRDDGVAELHYIQPDIYNLKEEEWYQINDKRLIIQDYMGEFIVLNIIEEGKILEINSPVDYFTGRFSRIDESQWNEFINENR